MPKLNGSRVRHRAAALGGGRQSLVVLADRAGINCRTLQNSTRETNPQPMNLSRCYDLARALKRENETVEEVLADIVADTVESPVDLVGQAS